MKKLIDDILNVLDRLEYCATLDSLLQCETKLCTCFDTMYLPE